MGEYIVGDFDSFEGYGIEIEAIGNPLDIVSWHFMQQWIVILGEEEKKSEETPKSRSPDSILYEPIVTEKKKEPEPDPEPRAEDFYCED